MIRFPVTASGVSQFTPLQRGLIENHNPVSHTSPASKPGREAHGPYSQPNWAAASSSSQGRSDVQVVLDDAALRSVADQVARQSGLQLGGWLWSAQLQRCAGY
jgi:hypothetical protein